MGYRERITMPDKPEFIIDSYPWAVPTEEQKRMFDELSQDQQLKMLQDALIEGEESGISDKSLDEITEKARAEMKTKQSKKRTVSTQVFTWCFSIKQPIY